MSTLKMNKLHQQKIAPQWTTFIKECDYHRKSQTGQAVSSSMLKEFRVSPARYFARINGKIPGKECHAFRIGRAVHTLLLEGEAVFLSRFIVGGPLNLRTGQSFGPDSQCFRNWLRDNGLHDGNVVTQTEAQTIACMREAVRRHKGALALLSHGWPERSAEAEYCGVPCQIRLDWLTPSGVAADVKTTRSLDTFEDEVKRYGYLYQLAFYRDVAMAAGGGRLAMKVVAVEKEAPFRVGVWEFSDAVLDPYSAQNQVALARLRRCRETGRWQTGYEAARSYAPAATPPVWLN